MQSRIMYIEPGGGLAGSGGRIGRIQFSKTGKTLRYRGQSFQSLRGDGYKENYYDTETGERYWISGPRKDGNDALYPMTIEVDENVREEYWTSIRNLPDLVLQKEFRSPGKYSRRRPHVELGARGTTNRARRGQ